MEDDLDRQAAARDRAGQQFADGLCGPLGALERSRSRGGTLHTFTIFTGPPNELCGPIHNRMPVIMPLEAWRLWLGEEEARIDELLALLRPYPAELMHRTSAVRSAA